MVKNLLLLDYGVSSAFPIILVPALTGLGSGANRNETMRITAAEASWLGTHEAYTYAAISLASKHSQPYLFSVPGSMLYILFVFTSLFSGVLIEPMGRKKAMLLVNIPLFFGWFSLYCATSHAQVFFGMALLGAGGGLMESPVLTYVGEIWFVLFRLYCSHLTIRSVNELLRPIVQ